MRSATHTERTRAVVHGEEIFIGSAAGEGLYVLSRRDGTTLRVLPGRGSVESAPHLAVETDDDGQEHVRVYFTDTGGGVWCYEADGTLRWTYKVDSPMLVRPTVEGDRVFVTTVEDLALALDRESGALLWRHQQKPDLTRTSELSLYGAPPAAGLGDGSTLFGFSDGAIVAIDNTTGDVRWTKRVGEGVYPDIVAEPVVGDTEIFASGYYEPLAAIHRETQNTLWSLPVGAASAVAVLEHEGQRLVYHPGTDGVLRAIVALTGAEKWSWDSESDGALSTPVTTPAGLLLSSSDSTVFLIDAETGEQRWRLQLDRHLSGITSSPVVAGRQVLFVTNAGYLHSMLVPATPEPWPPRP
jgi:outer membrane protein assembly factor BamB